MWGLLWNVDMPSISKFYLTKLNTNSNLTRFFLGGLSLPEDFSSDTKIIFKQKKSGKLLISKASECMHKCLSNVSLVKYIKRKINWGRSYYLPYGFSKNLLCITIRSIQNKLNCPELLFKKLIYCKKNWTTKRNCSVNL